MVTLQVVDTHVHFYTRRQSVYGGWPYPSDPGTYGDFLLADYLSDFAGANICGLVAIATRVDTEYVGWLQSLVRSSELLLSFVAAFPSDQNSTSLSRALSCSQCTGLRVKQSDLEAVQQSGLLAEAFETLQTNKQSLEVYGSPALLPLVSKVAERFPDLLIVVDHVAGCWPDAALDCSSWSHHLTRVGAHPNVVCKLSGLLELQGQAREAGSPRPASMVRVIDEVLASFPVSRLVFGSNWPVSLKYGPPTGNQLALISGLGSLPQAEIAAIFAENARKYFGGNRK